MTHRGRSSTPVSRRAFLRGCGATLTLPWLESLTRAGESAGRQTNPADKPPIRLACIFFSNGVEPAHWWAEGEGAGMRVGSGLEPMQAYCEDMVFLRGLYNAQAAAHKSAHLGRSPNLLSGAWVSTDQNEIRVGKSFDQVLVQTIGKQTTIPSLVVGIEPTELRLEDGLSMLYGSNISWATDTKPATKEIYPARVFDLLVGDGRGRQSDRSVLDEVLADANDLKRRLSRSDSQKLEEYLESVRSIETRIEHAGKEGRLEGWQPTLTSPNMARPGDALPQDVPIHMRLMLDLIVLAFQMDKTRIATCMLNNDLSQMNFKFVEGVRGALHLDLTHNGHTPALEAMYLKTNQFHMQQFTYLVERMKAIDEGGTSLLDNSMLMLVSNLYDGDKHGADQMPIVMAGKAGGAMSTGRVVDYNGKGDDNRRACSMYLSMMDRMGVHLDRFGDSDKRLKGFWADEA